MDNSIFLSYGIGNDLDGLYYYTYFYPSDISLSELAKNISDGFKLFEFKTFYIFNKNENIYFISNVKGIDSESYYLKYEIYDADTISVMNQSVERIGKINFIGASDYNNNKSIISISDLGKISDDDFAMTNDGFSKIKKYKISNSNIIYSLYIDEIEFLENEISDIKNIDDIKSILKSFKDTILDFIYPKNISCIICDNPIKLTNTYSICKDCFNKLHFLKDACLKCGKPIIHHNLEYENIKDCPCCIIKSVQSIISTYPFNIEIINCHTANRV